MNSRLVTQIETTAVTLADFSEWLKWDGSEEENSRMVCLFGAVKRAEQYTRRVLFKGTWRTYLNFFPSCVTLDVYPITLSTIVIKYFDVDNVEQTLATTEYFVRDNGESPPEIVFDGTMPSIDDVEEPIYLEYTAGYEAGYIPEGITAWVLQNAADNFENRQGTEPNYSGLFPYKIF
jgi:uncharacterized phiE125 gp8 family phage protein